MGVADMNLTINSLIQTDSLRDGFRPLLMHVLSRFMKQSPSTATKRTKYGVRSGGGIMSARSHASTWHQPI
jgi:2-phosphoglycerate kinase